MRIFFSLEENANQIFVNFSGSYFFIQTSKAFCFFVYDTFFTVYIEMHRVYCDIEFIRLFFLYETNKERVSGYFQIP